MIENRNKLELNHILHRLMREGKDSEYVRNINQLVAVSVLLYGIPGRLKEKRRN